MTHGKAYENLQTVNFHSILSAMENMGWKRSQRGLERTALYLPGSFNYDEITCRWKTLEQAIGGNGKM